MKQSNIAYLVVTDEIAQKKYRKDGIEKSMEVQICDLFMPDRRHPVDYELPTGGEPKKPGIYYPSHETYYLGQYGLNARKYISWISAEELQKELQALIKPQPAVKAA
jgi:hypothetical protein